MFPMKNSAIFIIFALFPLTFKAQGYDPEYDYYVRAMKLNLSDFTGVGYGSTQEEATDNAFMDLSVKLGVEVRSSTTVSYINGKKTVAASTSVDTKLSVPRGMVDTRVEHPKRKEYAVEATLKVKEYILDCERRMADCERYTFKAQGKYDAERWTALGYGLLGYWRSILDTPLYWNFDPKKTRERLEDIDFQMKEFHSFFKKDHFEPGVILDESLEIVQ